RRVLFRSQLRILQRTCHCCLLSGVVADCCQLGQQVLGNAVCAHAVLGRFGVPFVNQRLGPRVRIGVDSQGQLAVWAAVALPVDAVPTHGFLTSPCGTWRGLSLSQPGLNARHGCVLGLGFSVVIPHSPRSSAWVTSRMSESTLYG